MPKYYINKSAFVRADDCTLYGSADRIKEEYGDDDKAEYTENKQDILCKGMILAYTNLLSNVIRDDDSIAIMSILKNIELCFFDLIDFTKICKNLLKRGNLTSFKLVYDKYRLNITIGDLLYHKYFNKVIEHNTDITFDTVHFFLCNMNKIDGRKIKFIEEYLKDHPSYPLLVEKMGNLVGNNICPTHFIIHSSYKELEYCIALPYIKNRISVENINYYLKNSSLNDEPKFELLYRLYPDIDIKCGKYILVRYSCNYNSQLLTEIINKHNIDVTFDDCVLFKYEFSKEFENSFKLLCSKVDDKDKLKSILLDMCKEIYKRKSYYLNYGGRCLIPNEYLETFFEQFDYVDLNNEDIYKLIYSGCRRDSKLFLGMVLSKYDTQIVLEECSKEIKTDILKTDNLIVLSDRLVISDEKIIEISGKLLSNYHGIVSSDDKKIQIVINFVDKLSEPYTMLGMITKYKNMESLITKILIKFRETIDLKTFIESHPEINFYQNIELTKIIFEYQKPNIIPAVLVKVMKTSFESFIYIINNHYTNMDLDLIKILCRDNKNLDIIKESINNIEINDEEYNKLFNIACKANNSNKIVAWLYKNNPKNINVNNSIVTKCTSNKNVKLCKIFSKICPWYVCVIRYRSNGESYVDTSCNLFKEFIFKQSKSLNKGKIDKVVSNLKLIKMDEISDECCYICKVKHENTIKLKCGHFYCLDSLYEYYKNSPGFSCLYCKKDIDLIGSTIYIKGERDSEDI